MQKSINMNLSLKNRFCTFSSTIPIIWFLTFAMTDSKELKPFGEEFIPYRNKISLCIGRTIIAILLHGTLILGEIYFLSKCHRFLRVGIITDAITALVVQHLSVNAVKIMLKFCINQLALYGGYVMVTNFVMLYAILKQNLNNRIQQLQNISMLKSIQENKMCGVNQGNATIEPIYRNTTFGVNQGITTTEPIYRNIMIHTTQENTIAESVQESPMAELFHRNTMTKLVNRNTMTEPVQIYSTDEPQRNTITEPQRNTITEPQRNTITEPQRNTITEPIQQNTVIEPIWGNTATKPFQKNTVTESMQSNIVTEQIPRNTVTEPIQRNTTAESTELNGLSKSVQTASNTHVTKTTSVTGLHVITSPRINVFVTPSTSDLNAIFRTETFNNKGVIRRDTD